MQAQGSSQLPSQSTPNPKGNVSAVTLRSGKRISEGDSRGTDSAGKILAVQFSDSSSSQTISISPDLEFSAAQNFLNSSSNPIHIRPMTLDKEQIQKIPAGEFPVGIPAQQAAEPSIPLPFPQCKVQPRKNVEEEKAKEFQDLVNLFSKVEVNVPLLAMIKQIPKYAKFLKDLYVHKKKLKGNKLISMGKDVSTLIQPIPQKCEDPGVFTVPCEIGSNLFEDVIQTHLAGVIEDVLIKVRELIFPANFYILNMEGDYLANRSPLILGRPFLKTTRTKIDVHVGILSIEIGDKVVQFNILDSIKHPREDHSILSVDVLEELTSIDSFFDIDSFLDISDEGECEDYPAALEDISDMGVDVHSCNLLSDKRVDLCVGDCLVKELPQGSPRGGDLCVGDCLEEALPQGSPSIKELQLELKLLPQHLKCYVMDSLVGMGKGLSVGADMLVLCAEFVVWKLDRNLTNEAIANGMKLSCSLCRNEELNGVYGARDLSLFEEILGLRAMSRQHHRSDQKRGALILAFRPSFLFLSSRSSLMVPDLFQDESSVLSSHFTFSNPKPRRGGDGGDGRDGSDYMAWAERIKANRGGYFDRSHGRSVGAWTRRSTATPLMSSSPPRYVRHGWLSADQAEDDDGYGTSSPTLWKNSGNSPTWHSRRAGPTARAQEIARYRQEMLELVRGLPESEYELSLRDMVEDRGLLVEGKESKDEGEEKSKMQGKQSTAATGGLLLGMRFPFSVGDRRKRLNKSGERATATVSSRGTQLETWIEGAPCLTVGCHDYGCM
ncbi:hypothetical protein ZIOFF_022815 [Zingiber officinale]|uniref:Uncharacterized protein n=1 Tax=Zingiber officinale TaxID=94328 RepID=A0A8J5HE58_ZINOF|nr:hypothetical protein ZIOFF_022815 [Zingiber officinale]